MKVVLDTNVLVSGIFWPGTPKKVLLAWESGAFELLVSAPILDEYRRVAIGLKEKQAALVDVGALLELIVVSSSLVTPKRGPVPACDDPNDIMFLEAAIAGRAKFIVSGDRALLRVGKYPGGKVVTPKAFLDSLK